MLKVFGESGDLFILVLIVVQSDNDQFIYRRNEYR